MTKYQVQRHQIIESALTNFNADFFCTHQIAFGGGTRIALELDEYRESTDIDFFCPNPQAYRAVRETITNLQLNDLVKTEFTYLREIRADRYAVRTVIQQSGENIKLEFINFTGYQLSIDYDKTKFPMPFLDRTSCFYTKLLANCDRKFTEPYKDIFDLLAMYKAWGNIPHDSIVLAEQIYGEKTVLPSLKGALLDLLKHPQKYLSAAQNIQMKAQWADDLIHRQAAKLLQELNL